MIHRKTVTLITPSRQRGKVIVLALLVTAIISWQTLRMLDIGVRERKLFQQRTVAVQTRQAVFSISSAMLRQFKDSAQSAMILEHTVRDGTYYSCLHRGGYLRNAQVCQHSFTPAIQVSAALHINDAPVVVESGDGWQYLRLVSTGESNTLRMQESIDFAIQPDTEEIRVQRRWWLQ